jgi:hypothetical protein
MVEDLVRGADLERHIFIDEIRGTGDRFIACRSISTQSAFWSQLKLPASTESSRITGS